MLGLKSVVTRQIKKDPTRGAVSFKQDLSMWRVNINADAANMFYGTQKFNTRFEPRKL